MTLLAVSFAGSYVRVLCTIAATGASPLSALSGGEVIRLAKENGKLQSGAAHLKKQASLVYRAVGLGKLNFALHGHYILLPLPSDREV
ncbi:hypothetical protein PMI09_01030 [Rhizobium sp. CF122]|nr:hypothetical protein PMI09_01030 [Rhizobium sp. CF122]